MKFKKNKLSKKHIFKDHIDKYYRLNSQYTKFYHSIVIHEREIYNLR